MVSKMLADEGVRLPGSRRLQAAARARVEGIDVSEALLSELRALTRFKK
jgi:(2R)-3-sulfolactate dehydrogenase (NADP+)